MLTLQHELRNYIMENYFFGQGESLGNDDSFMELGIIDSTGVLELISHLEERYSIEIASEELIPENLDSIERLTRFVSRKLTESGRTPSVSIDAVPPRAMIPAGEAL